MKLQNYFDSASATPLDKSTIGAINKGFELFANPSGLTMESQKAKDAINHNREIIAEHFGVKASEIYFTSSASESNNLVVKGALEKDQLWAHTALEHHSIGHIKRPNSLIIDVDKNGQVDTLDLKKVLQNTKLKLISIMYVNNETGSIQNLTRLARIIKLARPDVLVHSDLSQAILTQDCNIKSLGLDLATISSSKIFGPRGIAALFVKTGITMKPLIEGGGQEEGLRSSTENVAGIIGFGHAVKLLKAQNTKGTRQIYQNFMQILINDLSQINIEPMFVSNNHDPHILAFRIPGYDAERLVLELSNLGFVVGTGSACGASDDEISENYLCAGFNNTSAREVIRVSFYKYNSSKSVKALAANILKVVKA